MKLVIAVVKPHNLDDVRDALAPLGVAGMTVTEARGFGRQKGQAEIYRGAEYATNLLPKPELERRRPRPFDPPGPNPLDLASSQGGPECSSS